MHCVTTKITVSKKPNVRLHCVTTKNTVSKKPSSRPKWRDLFKQCYPHYVYVVTLCRLLRSQMLIALANVPTSYLVRVACRALWRGYTFCTGIPFRVTYRHAVRATFFYFNKRVCFLTSFLASSRPKWRDLFYFNIDIIFQ